MERIRLATPSISWKPNKYFTESIDALIAKLRFELQFLQPETAELQKLAPVDDGTAILPSKRPHPNEEDEAMHPLELVDTAGKSNAALATQQ